MNTDIYLTHIKEKIRTRLTALLPVFAEEKKILHEAVCHSLLSGGKLLRPILTIATADMFSVPIAQVIDVACCIEMIHTYSLIHDDLPCMDDDDFRRGKPTLHKLYPEAIAVLTGDFLLTFSFETLASLEGVLPEKKNMLIASIAKRSGINGMIGGQIIDMTSEGKSIDEKLLKKMHREKTASLLIACLECGAILGEASPKELQSLCHLGEKLGFAYQIQDDILDIASTTQSLGKPAKSDVKNAKATSVACLGLTEAKKTLSELVKECFSLIQNFEKDGSILTLCLKKLFFSIC